MSGPSEGARQNTIAPEAAGWRGSLPVLRGHLVTLRELSLSDAAALRVVLADNEVSRLMSPPPATVEGLERFIDHMHRERQRGVYACFGVIPHGQDRAAGLFQIRQLDAGCGTAEWGFALASAYWGTGVFMDGASLVLRFVFEPLGVSRLEARAALVNGRGCGALRKLGAVQEAVLRRAFQCRGEYLDLALWSILETDWRQWRTAWSPGARVH